MKRTLIALLLALALVVIPVGSAFAATTADVTVTATPSILSISVEDKGLTPDPANWVINDVAETGTTKIVRDTTYYANPGSDTTAPSATVLATECYFTLFNDGDVAADITILMTDLNVAVMTNGEGGYLVNGATSFGASAYIEGDDWDADAIDLLTTPSAFQTALATGDIDFGVALLTQDDSFTSAVALSGTITLEATES